MILNFFHPIRELFAVRLPCRVELATNIQILFSSEGTVSNVDKIAAEHIKNLLVKVLVPVIKVTRTGPDMLEEYRIDYGYLGTLIHTQV